MAITREQAIQIVREEAAKRGIDPDVAERVAKKEGYIAKPGEAFQSFVKDDNGVREPSYGVFQLHERGVGANFQSKTGYALNDPSVEAERARIQVGLDHAAQNGWGAWYGARTTHDGTPAISNQQGLGSARAIGYAAAPTRTPAQQAATSMAHPLLGDPVTYNAGKFAAPRSSQYDGVDSKLRDILEETQRRLGVRVDVTPSGGAVRGRRKSTSQHVRGNAVDIQIYYPDGKPIPNYQNAGAFPYYQKFANTARAIQQEKYPELDNRFRWGGYFGGGPETYGALDLMHFDLGGSGMKGGSWENGLTQQQASIWGLEPGIAAGAQYEGQPEWARDVDNSNPIRVAYQPESGVPRPNPQMTPRRLDLNPAPSLPAAPTGPVDVASLPPLAMPMPPSQAAMAPPSYQTASLTPDMPASMAPWNRTTATEVMPTVPKPASWNTSFPPQTNRQAQQDIISQMSPDWQQRAAQLGLGTAPPRTTPNVQIANVDPMVNQAADIYRQTMGAPMPGYLDAARESATYRPANMPAYTPASLVPPTPANRTPDTPATPSMPAYQPARMVPDTPARMVSDTPARQTAWDAPIPPSPFDQAASIAQPSVAASQPSATPSSPSVNDRLAQAQRDLDVARQTPLPPPTAAEQWQTTRTLPSDRFMAPPPMPAPISTPTPATRTVTEQVINPEWQKWMDLQTAYPEAEGILAGLGPDTYLRTSRAEPDKWIVRDRTIQERNPYAPPKPPNTQLPFPNGVPPTRSPVQQFFHTVLDGAHSLGSGNIGAMGGLFGNMVWRNTLSVPEQARLMQAGVNPTYGGYTPTAFHSALTKPSASGGPNYDYTTGTDASGNFKSTYTADNGNTYSISEWPDSFSAPPNSTPFEVSWG